MKNLLKSTSALSVGVLAAGTVAFATDSASAAEKMKLGISGDMKFVVSYADQDSTFEKAAGTYGTINAVNDSEIHFSGNTTLDNGIRVDVMVQLETDQVNSNTGTVIDESYMKLTGAFGDLRMGSTKAASDTLANFGPVSGPIDNFDNSIEIYLINPTGTASPDTDIGTSDAMKIAYFTPAIEGFQLGVSYTPSETNSDSPPLTSGPLGVSGQQQTMDVGLGFNREISGVSVSADTSYWYKGGSVDQTGWRLGANFGYAGFTLGGSYANVDDNTENAPSTLAVTDYTAYEAGLKYETGPWTAAFSYYHASSPLAAGTAGSDTATHYQFSGAYNLGPGVDLLATVFRADFSDETTTASLNNDGWGVAAGIDVAF